MLETANIIDPALADSPRKMVDFRNVAVHEYHRLDMEIVAAVITNELAQILRFISVVLRLK